MADDERPVAVIHLSGEMETVQIARKIIAMETNISVYRQIRGELSEVDMKQMADAQFKHDNGRQWFTFHSHNLTPMTVLSKIQQTKARYQLDRFIVLVDGIYRMHLDEPDSRMNTVEKNGRLAEELQQIARQVGAPMIATHQYNKEVDKRGKGQYLPREGDLAEGREMKTWIDNLMLMYRPAKHFPDLEGTKNDVTALIIDKARNQTQSQNGRFYFTFHELQGYTEAIEPEGIKQWR
jgi:replicative DNA helicase